MKTVLLSIFFIKIYFEHYLLTTFICMGVLWTCIAVQCACKSHEDQKRASDSPRTGFTDGCELQEDARN